MLQFEDKALREIGRLGLERKPAEAVGVMVGDTVIELKNRSNTPTDHFQVEPQDIVDAFQKRGIMMTESEWLEMVLWHTHPSGLVGPSRFDMRHKIPQLRRHLVVALTDEGPVPSFY